MALIARADLTVKQGDTRSYPLTLTGAPDLSEATVNFRAWEAGAATDAIPALALALQEDGSFTLLLSADMVAALSPVAAYWYDVQVVGGPTIVEGRLYVEADRVR